MNKIEDRNTIPFTGKGCLIAIVFSTVAWTIIIVVLVDILKLFIH